MSELRLVKIGEPVIYCDSHGVDHHALVTEIWSQLPIGCINAVWVSSNEAKRDQYGRQIEHQPTSICHKDCVQVHGNYWRFVDEEPNPYTPPVGV